MSWRKGIMLIVIAVLALTALAGFFTARFTLGNRRQTLEEARAWQEGHYDLSWYDPLPKADYTVESFDGYSLHVQLLKNPADAGKYVLISHGYTDNRCGALKYAKLYLDLGFHMIVYDLRGHGLNEPALCTWSARERKDLKALIEDSRRRYPDIKLFGLHGESLGAATTVAVLNENLPVDFAVADCGFADISGVLKNGAKSLHVPAFLVDLASPWAKLLCGYSYSEMRPIDSLKNSRVPILFIHGAEDSLIPPSHSERMFEAAQCAEPVYLVPGAGHAMSVLTDPEGYCDRVTTFISSLPAGRGE